jgi:Flp pilus assembly pilin Flp
MDTRPDNTRHFLEAESGVTLIEYALVCFLIAVTCFLVVTAVGTNTSALYTAICEAVANATSGPSGC